METRRRGAETCAVTPAGRDGRRLFRRGCAPAASGAAARRAKRPLPDGGGLRRQSDLRGRPRSSWKLAPVKGFRQARRSRAAPSFWVLAPGMAEGLIEPDGLEPAGAQLEEAAGAATRRSAPGLGLTGGPHGIVLKIECEHDARQHQESRITGSLSQARSPITPGSLPQAQFRPADTADGPALCWTSRAMIGPAGPSVGAGSGIEDRALVTVLDGLNAKKKPRSDCRMTSSGIKQERGFVLHLSVTGCVLQLAALDRQGRGSRQRAAGVDLVPRYMYDE